MPDDEIEKSMREFAREVRAAAEAKDYERLLATVEDIARAMRMRGELGRARGFESCAEGFRQRGPAMFKGQEDGVPFPHHSLCNFCGSG